MVKITIVFSTVQINWSFHFLIPSVKSFLSMSRDLCYIGYYIVMSCLSLNFKRRRIFYFTMRKLCFNLTDDIISHLYICLVVLQIALNYIYIHIIAAHCLRIKHITKARTHFMLFYNHNISLQLIRIICGNLICQILLCIL